MGRSAPRSCWVRSGCYAETADGTTGLLPGILAMGGDGLAGGQGRAARGFGVKVCIVGWSWRLACRMRRTIRSGIQVLKRAVITPQLMPPVLRP